MTDIVDRGVGNPITDSTAILQLSIFLFDDLSSFRLFLVGNVVSGLRRAGGGSGSGGGGGGGGGGGCG